MQNKKSRVLLPYQCLAYVNFVKLVRTMFTYITRVCYVPHYYGNILQLRKSLTLFIFLRCTILIFYDTDETIFLRQCHVY